MHKIEPKTDDMMVGSSVGMKKGEPVKTFPRITMSHDFFPETKKWEVGKEYEVCLKLKMTGISISKYQNNSDFDIIGCDMEMKKEKMMNDDKKM